MKNILIVIASLILLGLYSCKSSTSLVQSDETVIYLVRHAEKANDGTHNPPLTKDGEIRANRLAKLLSEKGVSAVYSTNFLRTTHTAEPTAKLTGTTVQIHDHKAPAEFADHLRTMKGKVILVVGHSNSTPTLTNLLLQEEKYAQLSEKEYGKIFKVTLSSEGNTSTVLDY